MKIYTKSGDDGKTGLFHGPRVSKDDARIEAYGTVDELCSVVGLVRATGVPQDVDVTAEVGFTFFTIDPSDDVDQKADDYDEPTLRQKFSAGRDDATWYDRYLGQTIKLGNGTAIELDEQASAHVCLRHGRLVGAARRGGF